MTEGSPAHRGEQGRSLPRARWSVADAFTALRLPMAVAFVCVPDPGWRLAILGTASATDLLDGHLARRYGGSLMGAFLDPLADKLFMASAFAVVALSGALSPLEIVAVLVRDIVATAAFVRTALRGRAMAIPARQSGKAVTVGQVLTLVAFLLDSPLLRPLAWATALLGVWAIWDYIRVSARERRPIGG